MKPDIKVILPYGGNERIEVNKIKISKNHRSMEVELKENMSEAELVDLEEKIKSKYHLVSVHLKCPEDAEIKKEREMFVPVVSETSSFAAENPVHRTSGSTRRAHVSEMIYGRTIRGNLTEISNIDENSGFVVFEGELTRVELKSIHSKKTDKDYNIFEMDITDYKDSISAQVFLDTSKKSESVLAILKERLKKGLSVVMSGEAKYSDFSGETVVNLRGIGICEGLKKRCDNAPKKRVELHLHTQMSAMDAVTSTKELIGRAVSWGHTAIAITDHGVVQSYPDAMKASDNNEKIKVIYGVEGYLVNDDKKIVYSSNGQTIDDTFVVFDIETTGLSKEKNNITEIGAVKVSGGKIVDRWSSFVNPGEKIPENIVELTGITDEMVAKAPGIDKALPEFLEFVGDSVLVAHNANFDVGFIKIAARRYDLEFKNTWLDTLQLARSLYPDFVNHKLNTLAKNLNVLLENHHRAVDDAKATADIFIKMCDELKARELTKLDELNDKFDMAEASKKDKAYHIILLAKNEQGIRNIYEMVSASHLKYFYRTPRIPRSILERKREGLIIGSACEAGELMRAIVDKKGEEDLREIASFYDYLEIQPIGNNAYMKTSDEMPDIRTDEDLKNLNRKIVELGETLGKPVVATCDVHFVDPEGANFRKILMHFKGFKDADQQAPLYFRTTEEMLEEFSYLGNSKAYEVVVENTNLIADMIEAVRPIPKKKCPPEIDGAQEDIVRDSMQKAKEIYGDPLPEIVEKRLEKELHSITTYGFSVMYRIAQELVRKSLSDGYLVGSRGSVGSSFVAFLSDITEVNSLPAHYICPNCKNVEFIESETGISGVDMEDKVCPRCGTQYRKDGHDIPFETFLGFKGDKEPDIDLNFSGEYQPVIHHYTETYFGEGFVFRAGTIGTVAEKTALGYVRKYEEDKGIKIRNAEKRRLASGCEGVKRTSGQHPGGIIVVPHKNDIHEFCPVQHPADDVNSNIITTHFDYHSIDQNLLKLDELGHDDPTVIKMLQDLTGLEPRTIPLDDKETMSLFTSNDALKVNGDIGTKLGTYGVPEFGTKFVRQMLTDIKPKTFSELVRISGLSHGTDVWLNNAQTLIQEGTTDILHSICTRDDIMIYLISMGVEAGHAFKIMESVRKGKGLSADDETAMRAANVPDWYIDSCKKIKYMFPKAHAVAYVTMAFRIAYYKVHYPKAFYIAYYSVRADDFDYSIMAKGCPKAREALSDITQRMKNGTAAQKEEKLVPILEICIEMYERGIGFLPVDLYESDAVNFLDVEGGILPPLNALPGLGTNAAKSIAEARKNGRFKTVEDLRQRTGITKTNIELLEESGCLDGMAESDQVSLFDTVE